MSPRAAWRLEQLGFAHVYDYTAGKVDWLAAGEPSEGEGHPAARVLAALETAVPVCRLGDEAETAVAAAAAGGGRCAWSSTSPASSRVGCAPA
jgi:hypothetical protein